MINSRITLPSGAYFDTYIMDSEINYHEFRKRPAIIIAPGGAYAIHATKESEPVALEFMKRGYQTFVLKYSVGLEREHPEKGISKNAVYPIQVIEMFEALHVIKRNADCWNIDTERIFLMGFSAGGHVCASCGVRWNDSQIIERLSFKPYKNELKAAGVILGYPLLKPNSTEFKNKNKLEGVERVEKVMDYVLYQTDNPSFEQIKKVDLLNYISKDTVATFIWHSVDDPVVDSRNSTKFIAKLVEFGVQAEYHLFGHGEHGKALENRLTHMCDDEIDYHLNKWISLADYWMNRIGSR